MAIPDDFNPYEHLLETIVASHNRLVLKEFADVGDDRWIPDITSPRGSLRVASLIVPNDSGDMVVLRILLFYLVLNKIQDLIEPYYGFPIDEYQGRVKGVPTIWLYFREDRAETEHGYQPLRMRVHFQLTRFTAQTITKAELKTLATEINSLFPKTYQFHKGKELFTYKDRSKGINLQLYCYSKTDAEGLIEKVLTAAGHAGIDQSLLVDHKNNAPTEAYPVNPGQQQILGHSYKKPRKRPIGHVRFRSSYADIPGYPHPIALVDHDYKSLHPLIDH
jgi:hypothetical protein